MQLHDILQLRTSVILPEAISDGGLAPTTDISPPIEVGVISHLIYKMILYCIQILHHSLQSKRKVHVYYESY